LKYSRLILSTAATLFLLSIAFFWISCSSSPRGAPEVPPEVTSEASVKASEKEKRGAEEAPAPGSKKGAGIALRRALERPKGPGASGLKAGFSDDNRQFNYFIDFLKKYGDRVSHYRIAIEERIIIKVTDKAGKAIPNAMVRVRDPGGRLLAEGLTYPDGSFLFFPSEYGSTPREGAREAGGKYQVVVSYAQKRKETEIGRYGKRTVKIRLDTERPMPERVPLDILFILDTTGSMGEEISRLKATIEIINMNLSSLGKQVDLRFGMVLYRDIKDVYDTKVIQFTSNLEAFKRELGKVTADGGGDTPEDLQAALRDAMKKLKWNGDGVRLGFIVTDAPPHLDYGEEYTYVNAVHDARKMGIKLFGVGTGGLDLMGEYILRQIAQYTYGKYIFLTYGERGESEGGKPGSVSHHTGANYQTDKLEAIIIRFAKEEIENFLGRKVEGGTAYLEAVKVSGEEREETLKKLFGEAISELWDYSSIKIEDGTTISLLPIIPVSGREHSGKENSGAAGINAEYFTEQLLKALREWGRFKLVERADLQKIMEELELQLSELADESDASRVGKLMGAELLVMGKLYERERSFDIFLKLVRVETGEILSVTKVVIDRKLGL